MTREQYARMFHALNIYECDESGVDHRIDRPNTGRVMRHTEVDLRMLSLYFNPNKLRDVHFSAKSGVEEYFPARFWELLPDNMVKESDWGRLNVVPRAGRERRAFESLLESLR